MKKSITTLILGFLMLALTVPVQTVMSYSTNESLLEEIAPTEVMALIDDESADFESFEVLTATAADAQAAGHEVAKLHLERLAKARANADHLIDAYMISHAAVPLSPVPPLVEKISNDLTIYYLYQRRMRERIPEGIQQAYKTSLDSLRELQKGYIRASETPNPAANQIRTNKKHSDRLFSDENLRSY